MYSYTIWFYFCFLYFWGFIISMWASPLGYFRDIFVGKKEKRRREREENEIVQCTISWLFVAFHALRGLRWRFCIKTFLFSNLFFCNEKRLEVAAHIELFVGFRFRLSLLVTFLVGQVAFFFMVPIIFRKFLVVVERHFFWLYTLFCWLAIKVQPGACIEWSCVRVQDDE